MRPDEPRILVVDDEEDVREMLEFNLRLRGYLVRAARDGVEALPIIQGWRPHVIILDVVMPKIDGLSLMPMIRRLTEAPVIMLTARTEVGDIVTGLKAGADDYVRKPFEVAELLARLESALRRPALDRLEILTFDDLHVNLQSYLVTRAGERIELSAREFNVLAMLMRHPGRVFSRNVLFDEIWGHDSEADLTVVDRTISNLRAKVDQKFNKKLIQTVRGIGFTVRDDA